MKLSFTVATPDVNDAGILALRGDLEKNLKSLSEYGYHGVEFMIRDVNQLSVEKIKRICDDNSLDISAVSSGQLAFEDNLVISSPETKIREMTIERMKETIDFTQALGCSIVNVGTIRGQLPSDPEKSKEADRVAAESMRQILDYAEDSKIIIAFEPQCRYVVNWHNTLKDTFGWMQKINGQNFKILFDVYHTMIEENSIIASIIKYLEDIAHIQFSDSNRLWPGAGMMDFPEIIRVLKALDYSGYVSVEVLQKPTGLIAAKNAAKYLLPLIAEN
ncbi:MAG TPA: sugar phosphate isomerase/epimerase family protein [Draconibacterium sp.]|nr:sugar phosphate isomerase/epimerase family protein [Draconibacterium sp.]